MAVESSGRGPIHGLSDRDLASGNALFRLLLEQMLHCLPRAVKEQPRSHERRNPTPLQLFAHGTRPFDNAKCHIAPDAFLLGEKFIDNKNVALILGDNFFYGQNLTSKLIECTKLRNGARVILHKVIKPELFGVAKTSKSGKITMIKEKPKKFISDLAITGLYFFDKKVVEYAKKIRPSKRKELEITDLLNIYCKKKQLKSDILGRGGAWLDTGSIDDFYKTSAFVSAIENRQGFKIACLEEIALNNKWITKKHVSKSIEFYGKCEYSNYLRKFI